MDAFVVKKTPEKQSALDFVRQPTRTRFLKNAEEAGTEK